MSYNPNILRDALRARSLTQSQLSHRLGLSPKDLETELSREPEPRQGLLNDIAKELALPPFVFYMRKTPELHSVIPDFRSETPRPSAKSKQTIESIQVAESIQRIVESASVPAVAKLPALGPKQEEDIDSFALKVRDFLGISLQDQKNARDARTFYVLCRKKIEDKGIFVLHDSFPETDGSGFCLSHPTHPVIVVNTKRQTRGRRLFTLIHELAHVLMGLTGISDPFVRANSVERICNRFAGAFLVPETYVQSLLGNFAINDPDIDDVARAARRLKISQQATVLRLEQLNVFKAGSHAKWKKIIHNVGNPDFTERGGGGLVPPSQEKVKLAKYGFRFAAAFDNLLTDGRISELNLYRSTGLKPKYQRAYFAYVKGITADELQVLDLDDA